MNRSRRILALVAASKESEIKKNIPDSSSSSDDEESRDSCTNSDPSYIPSSSPNPGYCDILSPVGPTETYEVRKWDVPSADLNTSKENFQNEDEVLDNERTYATLNNVQFEGENNTDVYVQVDNIQPIEESHQTEKSENNCFIGTRDENTQQKEKQCAAENSLKIGIPVEDIFDERVPFTMKQFLQSTVPQSKRSDRKWDKRDLCLYCFEDVTNFSRHLFRKHNDQAAVQQIGNLALGSIARKKMIDLLRKKGNFLSPAQREIKPKRRPTRKINPVNLAPCKYCKGYYNNSYLKRHCKVCPARHDLEKQELPVTPSEAQTYLAMKTLDSEFAQSLRFKAKVLNLRSDEVGLVAKSEPLILSFAEFYCKRHKYEHLNVVTRNKMRELARLWIDMQKYIEDKTLFEAMKPQNYKYFRTSVENMAGYNDEKREFVNAPSLAMNMGTLLKQLCDHALNELTQKNPFFIKNINYEQKVNDIRDLKQCFKRNWNTEISSVANQNLVEKQWEKPTIIPLTSDIRKLNTHVKTIAGKCVLALKHNPDDGKSFGLLQRCCYTLLILFNRRRVGELERLLLVTYKKEQNDVISEEFEEKLSESEKLLLHEYKRIVIRGKRHKPVPVLVSKELQDYIALLLALREKFIPNTNPYLFATLHKNSPVNGYAALRAFCYECGADHPAALTSGKLRKHIATISQINNLNESDLEQLCTFLGHTKTTHQEFYRLPQEVYQTAKLASYLLKSQGNLEQALESEDSDIDEPLPEVVNTNKPTSPSMPLSQPEDLPGEEDDRKRVTARPRKKPKFSRVKWTEEQKSITREYFRKNISKRKPPVEADIEKFRKEFSIMNNKDWKKIKVFVYNEYNK